MRDVTNGILAALFSPVSGQFVARFDKDDDCPRGEHPCLSVHLGRARDSSHLRPPHSPERFCGAGQQNNANSLVVGQKRGEPSSVLVMKTEAGIQHCGAVRPLHHQDWLPLLHAIRDHRQSSARSTRTSRRERSPLQQPLVAWCFHATEKQLELQKGRAGRIESPPTRKAIA